MDRELTRSELGELLPLYALDALDGEEHAQVARYVERDATARAEVLSLREAAAFLPPLESPAPTALWGAIERSLESSTSTPPRLESPFPLGTTRPSRLERPRDRRSFRMAAVALAVAACVAIAVLGVQVARQRDRIDDLAEEMHRDPMERQAMAARAAKGAHVIELTASSGTGRAEIVMLPDGTGFLMDHGLPELAEGSTYQLWAAVGDPVSPQVVSLGVLGTNPGIVPFRVSAPTMMFEITKEDAPGTTAPGGTMVLSGAVA